MARMIQVIETYELRGKGTKDDICRNVKQFWSLKGDLLMEYDPRPTKEVDDV